MSTTGFRRVFGLPPDVATDLVVTVRNQNEIPAIAARIVDLLPDTRPISRLEVLEPTRPFLIRGAASCRWCSQEQVWPS